MDRIRGFDGLRALAILAVFFQHAWAPAAPFKTGGYGVWLFFCLSGFLIVRILGRERRAVEAGDETAGAALIRFFWRRSLRIAPIYYLVLVIFTVLALAGVVRDFTWPAAAWHYAALSNIYFGEVAGRWVGRFGHFWSLAVEQQFYLLAAPTLLLAPARWTRPLCLAGLAAAVVLSLGFLATGEDAMTRYTHSLVNFGPMALGGWLALGLSERAEARGRGWEAALPLAALCALPFAAWELKRLNAAPLPVIETAALFAGTAAAGLVLVGLYRNQESWLAHALEWKPAAYLGRVSYGFYLYHNLLPRRMVGQAFSAAGLGGPVAGWVEALFLFAISLGLAALSWRLIEQPILRLGRKVPALPRAPFLQRPPASAPTSA